MIEFFLPMQKIPTTTHQQKKVNVRFGKPIFYEPEDLKNARAKFESLLAQHVPHDETWILARRCTSGQRDCRKVLGRHSRDLYQN